MRVPSHCAKTYGWHFDQTHQWRQGSMHLVCVTRSSAPTLFQYSRPGALGEFQDARLPRARCADVARTHFEKRAEMTQTRCGNNLQAFGGHCFAPSQTDHRRAVIGRHQRASGGKTAHEGNAPQRAIDRHGHLDCPHRGREAGSSRSVAFPQLGGKKGQRTPVSY
jgi:hypothetical protein